MLIYKRSKTSLIILKKYTFNNFFFFISTLNSMGGVMCSPAVREQLKMRKSLRICYWKDTISGVKVNNNFISINKLWRVSTTQLTFPCSKSTIETLKRGVKYVQS